MSENRLFSGHCYLQIWRFVPMASRHLKTLQTPQPHVQVLVEEGERAHLLYVNKPTYSYQPLLGATLLLTTTTTRVPSVRRRQCRVSIQLQALQKYHLSKLTGADLVASANNNSIR